MAFTTRPLLRGANGAVTAGHYLGAEAGMEMLREGGNAVDAAAAASFVLTVVEPHLNGLAGEVPILIYSKKRNRVVAISGQGTAPAAMTLEAFVERGLNRVPGEGLLGATVPALLDAWIVALRSFGSLPLHRILEPAIRVAEQGYAVYSGLANSLKALRGKIRREWPTTARLFYKRGRTPEVGEILQNWPIARVFRGLARASKRGGLRAARAYFYEGPIAAEMDKHSRKWGGFLRREDLKRYRGRIEAPIKTSYRDTVVHKCNTWCQGLVFLQQLNILETFNLRRMGHNSPEYIHTWIECAKLAFADREAYYGDPLFADVPLRRLNSKAYARRRRRLIGRRPSMEMRPDGLKPYRAKSVADSYSGEPLVMSGDTTHIDAIDRFGNMVAATPSGGWMRSSPVIASLGFPLGTRGQMFAVDPDHPNRVEPGKRPRTTLTPSLAFRKGKPWLVFGTPGGDQQDQWTLQFFLNVVDFGMDLQEAVDAATVHTEHFPSSFYPRGASAGLLVAESRIDAKTLSKLRARGHKVKVNGAWTHGRVLGIAREPGNRVAAAASPRFGTAYAQVY